MIKLWSSYRFNGSLCRRCNDRYTSAEI